MNMAPWDSPSTTSAQLDTGELPVSIGSHGSWLPCTSVSTVWTLSPDPGLSFCLSSMPSCGSLWAFCTLFTSMNSLPTLLHRNRQFASARCPRLHLFRMYTLPSLWPSATTRLPNVTRRACLSAPLQRKIRLMRSLQQSQHRQRMRTSTTRLPKTDGCERILIKKCSERRRLAFKVV